MAIQPHNEKAAATWGSGGTDYDRISECIADAIEHMLNRIDVRPGERVLDLATGTGWTARRLAQKGAEVTGLDIGAGVIEAARGLAERAGLRIAFMVGDAERVELPDAGFDVVTSTLGVMFASRPEAAAGELARLCRPGGRIGLVTWSPTGTIAGMFQVMRPYMPPPPSPAPPSPFEWGRPERVRELLGGAFNLKMEQGVSYYREPGGEAAWDTFSTGYGPVKSLAAGLDEARRAEFRRDFIAFHDGFPTGLGICVPREYLLTVGVRR